MTDRMYRVIIEADAVLDSEYLNKLKGLAMGCEYHKHDLGPEKVDYYFALLGEVSGEEAIRRFSEMKESLPEHLGDVCDFHLVKNIAPERKGEIHKQRVAIKRKKLDEFENKFKKVK